MAHFSINPASAEILTKWYLRLNGYFTVDNFIVHAADDDGRISNGKIGNHTEIDVLAIRNQYGKEISGRLQIANDPILISNPSTKIDFIIAESKTGNEDRPNKIWRDQNVNAIEYILRFAGFLETEETISEVSQELSKNHTYRDADDSFSVRLIVFSENKLNKNWSNLPNIRFSQIIDFIVDVRGECWVHEQIGIASIHQQWNPLINEVFEIANDLTIDRNARKVKIETVLKRP